VVLLKLFQNGDLEYINCGHVTPLATLGNEVRKLDESNLIVGLIPTAKYASSTCKLRAGERILLPTDGLTEAEDSNGQEFGESGLITCAPYRNCDEILEEVAKFSAPNPAQDDCTLLELRYMRDA
jgi:serine phosphatase RsbU (regulator of sigma subunit)